MAKRLGINGRAVGIAPSSGAPLRRSLSDAGEVECCCPSDPLGACCLPNGSCVPNVAQGVCKSAGGVWYPNQNCTTVDCGPFVCHQEYRTVLLTVSGIQGVFLNLYDDYPHPPTLGALVATIPIDTVSVVLPFDPSPCNTSVGYSGTTRCCSGGSSYAGLWYIPCSAIVTANPVLEELCIFASAYVCCSPGTWFGFIDFGFNQVNENGVAFGIVSWTMAFSKTGGGVLGAYQGAGGLGPIKCFSPQNLPPVGGIEVT